MSMLAAPRRKQKISNLNPNGLNFVNDESNIGQKLMRNMGWEKGTGLGKGEQGALNPIKPKINLDNRGLGCDHKTADNWIAHQDDFNTLLADLNADNPDGPTNTEMAPVKVSSLEKASKKSKTRLHYIKYAQGKDLSMRSDKDIAMIFGRKSNSSTPAPKSDPSSKTGSDDENDNDSSDPFLSDVMTQNSTMSLQDYFAAKMASRANSRVNSANELSGMAKTPSPLTNSEPDPNQVEQEQPSFFIGDDLNAGENSNDLNGEDTSEQKAKKLKKKKKRRHDEPRDEGHKHSTGGKTKPKPVDDSMTFISDTSDQSNDALPLRIEQDDMERTAKKSKKSKKGNKDGESDSTPASHEQISDNDEPVKKKKSKKDKKNKRDECE